MDTSITKILIILGIALTVSRLWIGDFLVSALIVSAVLYIMIKAYTYIVEGKY